MSTAATQKEDSLSSKLRFVGFCGADDSVSPELLSLISSKYPWIEWGVLFRSDLQGTPRYASPQWVEALSVLRHMPDNKMRLAAHFCFDRCQQILDGDASFAQQVFAQWGFHRIQINATAANGVVVDHANLDRVASNIRHCMESVPGIEFIFQLNDETRALWQALSVNAPHNVCVLHDASCGKGIGIAEFPSPTLYGASCGYAGGIGPQTIDKVLHSVNHAVKSGEPSVWIDMESSLRSIVLAKRGDEEEKQDIFDINKCMQCVEIVKQHGF